MTIAPLTLTPEQTQQMLDIINRRYDDGVESIEQVGTDEAGDIVGIAVDSDGTNTIRLAFKITDTDFAFNSVPASPQGASFNEWNISSLPWHLDDWSPVELAEYWLEFADKKRNCKKGKPCKGTCIAQSRTCRDEPLEEEASKISEIKAKNPKKGKGKGKGKADTKTTTQDEPKQEQEQVSGRFKVSVQGDTKIKGDQTVSEQELKAIGVKVDARELSSKDVERLNVVRNGKASYEEFLNSPADDYDQKQEVVFYQGDRVKAYVTKEGDVNWSVDSSFTSTQSGKVPTGEIIDMARSFEAMAKSPVGQRFFICSPSTSDGLGDTRTKLYKKRGFQEVEGMGGKLYLNNTGQSMNTKQVRAQIKERESLAFDGLFDFGPDLDDFL